MSQDSRLALRLFVVFLLPSLCLRAQEPQALKVAFSFKPPDGRPGLAMGAALDAQKKAVIEQKIAKVLVEALEKQIPYWTFEVGSTADKPRLSAWVQKRKSNWEVFMTLVTKQGAGEEWVGTLFAPGDLEGLSEGLPAPDRWPDVIPPAFSLELLDKQKERILASLEELIPLGEKVAALGTQPPQTPDQARAVLPLDWSKHCRLAKSEFRLVYARNAGGGQVTLHSVGVVGRSPYTSGALTFDGITVLLQQWEFGGITGPVDPHLVDLPTLNPVAFYLKRPISYVESCESPDGSGLLVAP